MNKLKIFFAACALLASVGVQAQEDVTSTYLTNADFSSGTPIDNNVCTYGKDMEGNGTTFYGAQAIEGWTNESVGDTDDKGYENSKLAGAIFAYGSTPWLAGVGTPAPETGPEGNAGNAAGLCAVWGGSVQYTQSVTLKPGSYTIRYVVYNATTNNGSGKFITTNLFGFVADGGATYFAPSKTFAIGQWSTVAVTFNLTEETAGKISMGYVGPTGNANMPHLFVDNVKILKNTYFENVTSKVGVQANTNWINATDGMQGNGVTTDDGRNTQMAARYGNSQEGKQIYQTVTGLGKGTYEAVVYAYSQNEWNNNANLQNDAGDVGFVMAEGVYDLKTWINARRGPGYPTADGPGIYTLSGIEVGDDGQLTLSYNIATSGKTEWHAIQIKSLIYTKNLDLSGLISAYEAALENAQNTAKKTDPMQTSLMEALQQAITANSNVDKNDADALEAATSALLEAVSAVEKSIAAYASANDYFTRIEAELANTNFYTADAYNANYTAPKAKYDARTLTTEEASALNFGSRVDGNMPALLLSAWTFDGTPALTAGKPYMNTWSTEGNNDGSNFRTPFFEYWVGDNDQIGAATIQGEMTGLKPNQLYEVDIWARLRATNNKTFATNGVTMQVGEGNVVDFTKATQIGTSRLYADVFNASGKTDANGKLTVKIVVAVESGSSWLSYKNVKFAELADERIPLADQLATAVANAQSLANTLDIPSGMKDALGDIVAKYQNYTYTSLDTAAEFLAAIDEVNGLIDVARAMVEPYALYKTQRTALQTLPDQDTYNDPSNAKGAFETALNAADANVEAALTAAAITAETANILAAAKTFVKSVTVKANQALDLTALLVNPHFYYGSSDNPIGWTLESGSITELRTATHNFEAYRRAFNLSQTVTDLPKGTYEVTLQGFARHDGSDTDKTNLYCGIVNQPIKGIRDEYSEESYYYDGVTALGDWNYDLSYTLDGKTVYQPNGMTGAYYWFQKTNPLTGEPFYTNKVETLIKEAGDLKIGFKCETNMDWVIWDNFHLYYYGSAINVTMTEELGTSFSEDIDDANVTMTKTLYNGWNSIVVPFSVSVSELVSALPASVLAAFLASGAQLSDLALYSYKGMTGSELNFENAGTAIEANVPYLVYSPYNFGQLTVTLPNRHIVVGNTVTSTGAGYEFAGVYQLTEVADGDYILGESDFLRSNGGNKVPAYRAYIKKTTGGADETRLSINIDGVATAIGTIDGVDVNANGAIYNMAGQQVKKAQKGLYIQNGKKMVVR